MPIRKIMKSLPSEQLVAKGLMYQDWEALTPCQRECTTRLGMTVQIEQEAYMTEHPEIIAMLELFLSKMTHVMKRKSHFLKEAADFFLRPHNVIDAEVRQRLGVPEEGSYIKHDKRSFRYEDTNLKNDLKNITMKYYPPEAWKIPIPSVSTPATMSSSFLSIKTSDTTLPTPEPVPPPVLTLSETLLTVLWNTVDKAVFLHVNDELLLYDTAYIEVSKAVEVAMEIPVIEIREDIANLFYNAYKLFNLNIMEKERIAAEVAWSKRMRKKMKRTLRRQANFKGYEAPASSKSSVDSSHESDRRPPVRPCDCHPQFHYNRYAKDRFGIYLPIEEDYVGTNMTATPAISIQDEDEDEDKEDKDDKDNDNKSVGRRNSAVSTKSTVSKKA